MKGIAIVLSLVAASLPSAFAATALESFAESLAPGEWGQMQTNGLQSTIGNTGGASGHILTFAHQGGGWYPASRKMMFVGGDHNGGTERLAVYDDASNTWSVGPGTGSSGNNQNHGHGNNAPDVTSNRHYYMLGSSKYFDIAGNTWVGVPSSISGALRANQAYSYMPGVGLIEATYGGLYRLPNGGSWQVLASQGTHDFGGEGGLVPFNIYNPKLGIAWFGGGDGTNNNFTLSPNLQVVSRPDPPFAELSGNDLNQAVHNHFTYDPVTGDFLVTLAVGSSTVEFWSFDLNNWIRISSDLAQFSNLNNLFAIPVNTYGVVVWLHKPPDGSAEMWVYKHEQLEADDTRPDAPKELSAQ